MINIDFVKINNAILIGRLLPFWARGRKTSLLLQAILSPIISAHNNFKAWALERFIECHITSQRPSLEWFLKYKLKKHFLNGCDVFTIVNGNDKSICCFNNYNRSSQQPWDNQMLCDVNAGPLIDTKSGKRRINDANRDDDNIYNRPMLIDSIVVNAPAIVNTINYNYEDYERDIRYIMSKYMINFKRIYIIIANTN